VGQVTLRLGNLVMEEEPGEPAKGADPEAEENAETHEEEDAGADTPRRPGGRRKERIKAKPGMNVFAWDMRRALPTTVPRAVGWPMLRNGPRVLPGAYAVRLLVDGRSWVQPLTVRGDPRLAVTQVELDDAAAYIDAVYKTLDGVHRSVNRIRDIRRQVQATVRRAKKAKAAKQLQPHAKQLLEAMQEIEDALIQSKNKAPQDPLNFPTRLNDKLTMLLNLTNRDPRPTQGMRDVLAHLETQAQQWQVELALVEGELVPAFNQAVADAKLPAVVVPARRK